MPVGIECFNAAGVKTFEGTDYLGRILGRIQIYSANGPGSIWDGNLNSGVPWALFFRVSELVGVATAESCLVTVDNASVSWRFEHPVNAGGPVDGYILYGVR